MNGSFASIPVRLRQRLTTSMRIARAAKSADAIIASFPKCGRTWVRYILAQYLNLAFDLRADLDLHTMFSLIPNLDMDPVRGVPAFAYRDHEPNIPLILCTHRDYKRDWYQSRPILLLIRDPRDVMVSAYFHARFHKHRFNGELRPFLADEKHGLPALARYLNGWAVGLKHNPHYVVCYEKLSADPVAETSRILTFLRLPVDESAVRGAVEASQFGRMRALEIERGIPGHDYDRNLDDSLRMRKGKTGGYVDHLSEQEIQFIHSNLSARLNPDAKLLVNKSGFTLG